MITPISSRIIKIPPIILKVLSFITVGKELVSAN